MKRELEHFYIEGSYGGNQDWFPTFMMRVGGCGAETACDSSVYFALHRSLTAAAPQNAAALTKDDYIAFAYKMKPYLSPRMSGIDRLDIFTQGYSRYLADCGETRLTMAELSGNEPYEKAREAVTGQIDGGYPVPVLILSHRNRKFRDYVWHWFLVNGYNESGDVFEVKAVNYSGFEWLNLRELWDTGFARKGGLILFNISSKEDERGGDS